MTSADLPLTRDAAHQKQTLTTGPTRGAPKYADHDNCETRNEVSIYQSVLKL
jgi:hypothetical protein